mmetsp:Transcript_7303/g.10878  ORF Transcript_7303/g.10878 Transcript_7303/m.10878 type:complete len:600 (-) Transcript_7303:107-1906(-)
MGGSSSKESDKDAVKSGHINDEEVENLVYTSEQSSKVQLSISCENLVNMDKGNQGLSDPFVVVKARSSFDDPWVEIDRTEICSNTLNPNFVRLVTMFYHFEEIQYLKFEVYDADTSFSTASSKKLSLQKQDFQGSAECALALIVGGAGQSWTSDLYTYDSKNVKKTGGKITVRAEEVPSDTNKIAEISLEGKDMTANSKHLKGLEGFFFKLSRVTEGQKPILCYKSNVVPQVNRTVKWEMVSMSTSSLCAGDFYRPIMFQIFAYKRNGQHTLMGSAKGSLNDFLGGLKNMALEKISKQCVGSGTLVINDCKIKTKPTFLEYLAAGMEVGFHCAIDYTASNGHPSSPHSLHFISPNGENHYSSAIKDVGGVIEYYDTDKKFPVFGFGGRPVPRGPTEHCFPVNGNDSDPEVYGVSGILATYRESLSKIELSGPTLFAPVISNSYCLAQSEGESSDLSKQMYTILMILTDGQINDMGNTVDAIVAASEGPFSIIIVGVGDADFTCMNILDGDEKGLVDRNGKKWARDIVQFVPLNKFKNADTRLLAKEVLAEVPRQVVDYMTMKGILPGDKSLVPRGMSIRQVLDERQMSFKQWERENSVL